MSFGIGPLELVILAGACCVPLLIVIVIAVIANVKRK